MAPITEPALAPAAVTYDAFAPAYDAFTAHHDYARWIPELAGLARAHGMAGRALLDAGCGTGKSLEAFLDLGFRGVGCDVSAGMLASARHRIGDRAPLVHADVRALPALGRFDLVTCVDDVLNYMDDEDDLVRALGGLRANLGDRGVLLFDLNELATYRSFFSETVRVEREGMRMTWRGLGPEGPEASGHWRAELELPEGRVSVHRQRHFPSPVVRDALAEAGLACAGVYGQDLAASFHPGVDPDVDTKAVYLALPRRSA